MLWLDDHPELLLRAPNGALAIDPEWPDEFIFDTASAAKRAQLVAIVGEWVDGCARDGFQAVEIENLDSYSRFPQLNEDDAVDFARALAARAHEVGLAVGQKNAVDLVGRREETAFDFVIVEQCNEYEECDQFIEGYGDQVYVIEYERDAFERGCAKFPQLSIVFRDLELSTPTAPIYTRDAC